MSCTEVPKTSKKRFQTSLLPDLRIILIRIIKKYSSASYYYNGIDEFGFLENYMEVLK